MASILESGPGKSVVEARRAPRSLVLVLAASAFLLAPGPAQSTDGVALDLGKDGVTNAKVKRAQLGVQWDWKKRWLEAGNWHVGGYWDLGVGYWDNDTSDRTSSALWEIGFTPVFRLQQTTPAAIAPYAEIGIGAHLLSETTVSAKRDLGGAVQFGSHVGLGARFGPRNALELGYRYQHLSNAGLDSPNDGIDFHSVRFGYWFQ